MLRERLECATVIISEACLYNECKNYAHNQGEREVIISALLNNAQL